jgi:S1-C subfamily serine protease
VRPITVGRSNDIQAGQKVFASGNPFGFDQTIISGIISALNRKITAVTGRMIRGVIRLMRLSIPAIPAGVTRYVPVE